MGRKEIFTNNFIGGIAWALGATIGGAIILAIIGFILSKVDLIPVVGDLVSKIAAYVSQNNPHLLK